MSCYYNQNEYELIYPKCYVTFEEAYFQLLNFKKEIAREREIKKLPKEPKKKTRVVFRDKD